MDITNCLSFFARLYRVDENPEWGMRLLYLTIVVLCIIVYKLGFARKLPLLKSMIVYLFLILGCTILSSLAIFLPIAEGLVVAMIVLVIYKIRKRSENRNQQIEG